MIGVDQTSNASSAILASYLTLIRGWMDGWMDMDGYEWMMDEWMDDSFPTKPLMTRA
jgi:hypothetical protein